MLDLGTKGSEWGEKDNTNAEENCQTPISSGSTRGSEREKRHRVGVTDSSMKIGWGGRGRKKSVVQRTRGEGKGIAYGGEGGRKRSRE